MTRVAKMDEPVDGSVLLTGENGDGSFVAVLVGVENECKVVVMMFTSLKLSTVWNAALWMIE